MVVPFRMTIRHKMIRSFRFTSNAKYVTDIPVKLGHALRPIYGQDRVQNVIWKIPMI